MYGALPLANNRCAVNENLSMLTHEHNSNHSWWHTNEVSISGLFLEFLKRRRFLFLLKYLAMTFTENLQCQQFGLRMYVCMNDLLRLRFELLRYHKNQRVQKTRQAM